jgi:hypothetical protein
MLGRKRSLQVGALVFDNAPPGTQQAVRRHLPEPFAH